jgi:hypothetical protein
MNSSDFSFIPFSASATSRISCDIFIEQNLGPHIEQNTLPLQLEVFHHEILAVSGSNDRLN